MSARVETRRVFRKQCLVGPQRVCVEPKLNRTVVDQIRGIVCDPDIIIDTAKRNGRVGITVQNTCLCKTGAVVGSMTRTRFVRRCCSGILAQSPITDRTERRNQ